MNITIQNKETLTTISKNEFCNGIGKNYVHYLAQLLNQGVSHYIDNSGNAKMSLVTLNDFIIPIVTSDASEKCYITSPFAHYIKYSAFELNNFPNGFYKLFLKTTLKALGLICRTTSFNKAVYINNWLFSTNPPLHLKKNEIEKLKQLIVSQFNDKTIIIRSVDSINKNNLSVLEKCGFDLVINREVYFWDPLKIKLINRSKRENVRRDMRLADKKGISLSLLSNATKGDFERLANLYKNLYIDKYTELNPVFTNGMLELVCNTELLKITQLKYNYSIIGFVALFETDTVIYPLMIGYDVNLDSQENLNIYRVIFGSLFSRSIDSEKLLFLSSGSGLFKKNRGAYPQYEYEAVYTNHLSSMRKLPWKLVRKILDLNARKIYDSNSI